MSADELVLQEVSAGYGRIPVVHGISLSIGQGSRWGVLGRNGAGKSTMLACVIGLSDKFSGSIRLGGVDIGALSPYQRSRMGIGYVPQGREIFPSLTVEENLIAAVKNQTVAEALALTYRLFPRLQERRSNGGSQLSGGEQQMLAVARAVVGKPQFLLLDEPLEGLAPLIREQLIMTIRAMTNELGIGCILVEQYVDVVLNFASHVLVLEAGTVAFKGSVEDLRRQPEILERAIGLSKL